MTVYIVRHIETQEIHGIVWGNKPMVWDIVDSMSDPSEYEVKPVKAGGLLSKAPIGEGQTIKSLGGPDDEDSKEFSFAEFECDECLCASLYDDGGNWTQLDYTDQGVGLIARVMGRAA